MTWAGGPGRRIRGRTAAARHLGSATMLAAALGWIAPVSAEERRGMPAVSADAAEAGAIAGSNATPSASDRVAYEAIVAREALDRGVPPPIADAVAFVESGYDTRATGTAGELGLMQVRPATAAMLGHRGPATDLYDPVTNVRYGVAYLARAWKLAGGDLCRTLMKYRAGHGEERISPRSSEYCRRARVRLASIGSPPANAPLRDLRAGPYGARQGNVHSPRRVTPSPSALNLRLWAEHAARVRASEARADRIMRGG